ncbi:MAG: hypothetical protein EAX87_11015 [Candidatus Thorarchaeota archaeon]|nr:hypothetical protein [Candidatus Thorarchaeota archaeon]
MSEKRDELLHLVMDENVSAVEILADRLELTSDEVVQIIKELLASGELKGTLAEDESRFFKSDVKLSSAPAIERDNSLPSFLSFNSKPAMTLAVVGFLVIAGGIVIYVYGRNTLEQNVGAILFLLGLIVAFIGLYWIAKHPTPP